MPPLRFCYLAASIGFALSAVGAIRGIAPPWPNDVVWTGLAILACLGLAAAAFSTTLTSRDWATSTVVVASGARMVGWIFAEGRAWPSKVSAAGVWLVVASLMFVVHHKARQLRGGSG